MLKLLPRNTNFTRLCFILFAFYTLLTHVDSNGMRPQTIVATVSALRRYFHAKCVYFVSNGAEDLSTHIVLMNMIKSLNDVAFPSTFIPDPRLLSFMESSSFYCKTSRPFFVLLNISLKDMHLINKISSSMRLSEATWLQILDTEIPLIDVFTDVYIPFDCEYMVAQAEDGHVVLTEIYRVSPTSVLQTYPFGEWSSSGGLTWPNVSFYRRRNNLQGLTLKTALVKKRLVEIVAMKNGKPLQIDGYFGGIWLVLENKLNFKSDYLIPSDKSSGSNVGNGTWSGVVGMIMRKEADVSNIGMFWDIQRYKVVDFITVIDQYRFYMNIRRPESEALDWSTFLLPFTTEIWLCLASSLLLTSIIMFLIHKIAYNCYAVYSDHNPFNFLQSVFFTIQALSYQGCSSTPKLISGRIVFLMTYICSMFLIISYSAFLISYLMTSVYDQPFTSFQEFLQDGTYSLGVIPNSAQYMFFKLSNNSVLNTIYHNMIKPHELDPPKDMSDGLHRICTLPKYASMVDELILAGQKLKPPCPVMKVPKAYSTGPGAMAIQNKSPYKGLLKHCLHNMMRSGLLKMFRKRNIVTNTAQAELKYSSVLMTEAVPIFTLLAVGIVISLFILIIECIVKRSNQNMRPSRKGGTLYAKKLIRYPYCR